MAVRREFFAAGLRAGFEHDDGVYGLAPFFVGHANNGAHRHRRVAGEGAFHFGRVDVFAAGDDHVFDAVDDIQVAMCVHHATVTGVQPAAGQGLAGVFIAAPVALHHRRAAHQDLAVRACGQLFALGVGDADLGRHPCLTSRADALAVQKGRVTGNGQGRDGGRGFGHAIHMDEVHLGKGLQGAPQQGQRDGCRAPQNALQLGQALRVKAGGVEQHLQHAGHDDKIVHAFAGHDLDHRLGLK